MTQWNLHPNCDPPVHWIVVDGIYRNVGKYPDAINLVPGPLYFLVTLV